MVLTDLPFERGNLLHSRYDIIRRPESAPPPVEETPSEAGKESKEYAAFLKAQARKVGPEGFLDSTRYSHTFQFKKDKETKAAAANKGNGKPRAHSDTMLQPNVVDLSAKVEKDEKDYQKRIKIVEDHMWQHKQEERELKRVEGDIIKNQRAVRHTLRDFGTAINKKRMAEEKKLSQSLERFADMQREHTHKKHEIGSQRMNRNVLAAQHEKSQGRKVDLQKNDLSKQYQQKMSALELKRLEVMRLSQDYESKMRSKEEEQHRLKKELAELALTLNMIAQKGRVQEVEHSRSDRKETTQRLHDDVDTDKNPDNRMQRGDGDNKGTEMTKSKQSNDLALTKPHLDLKRREDQRRLTDAHIRVEDAASMLRQMNDAAKHTDHNAKRMQRQQASLRNRTDKEEGQQVAWETRFKNRCLDKERKKHEDSLRFFSKTVLKDEEKEQSLFNTVREAEYARQKKEQEVRRLQQRLLTVRANNQQRLKQQQLQVNQSEKELEQELIREKAQLDKMHARREETYIQLQSHRCKMKEDRHLLEDRKREHNRLLKLGGQHSDITTTTTLY